MKFNRREKSLVWAALNSKAVISMAVSRERHLSEDQRTIHLHLAKEYQRLANLVKAEGLE